MKYQYHVVVSHYDGRLKAMLTLSHFVTRGHKLDRKSEIQEMCATFEEHYRDTNRDIVEGSTCIVSWILVSRKYEWFDLLGPACGISLASLIARLIVPIIRF